MLAALLGMMALAIDLGMLLQVRARLQGMADASALAAAQELPSAAGAKAVAQAYATQNDPDHGTVVAADEVVVGNWDGLGTFTPGGAPTNAVRVVARRTEARNNPVVLFFAKALGVTVTDVVAWATATSGGEGGVVADHQFLIDSEMLDSDIETIKAIARAAGKEGQEEDIINDLDGDWFIDLHQYVPLEQSIELPTGQTGDEGMFDIDQEAFEFLHTGPATPDDGPCTNDCTYNDFLNYNEDSNSWRYNLFDKKKLDPLLGVDLVSHNHRYPYTLTEPTPCMVSPVYKGDVNKVTPAPPNHNVPAVNGLGWRRGLLAFRIDSIGEDPDGDADEGGGSVLPNVWISREHFRSSLAPPFLAESFLLLPATDIPLDYSLRGEITDLAVGRFRVPAAGTRTPATCNNLHSSQWS